MCARIFNRFESIERCLAAPLMCFNLPLGLLIPGKIHFWTGLNRIEEQFGQLFTLFNRQLSRRLEHDLHRFGHRSHLLLVKHHRLNIRRRAN